MIDSRIRLILLDFDGTLADTRRANAMAYAATLQEAGYPLSEEEYLKRYFGMRCTDFLRCYGITGDEECHRLRKRKVELYPSFFHTVELNLALWNLCQQFRAQGVRVWIVSMGHPENIRNVMTHLGILDGIDGIMTGDDVAHGKPAPDCFLEAMRHEGCTPRETLIFEDSPMGVEAARRSGAAYFVVKL